MVHGIHDKMRINFGVDLWLLLALWLISIGELFGAFTRWGHSAWIIAAYALVLAVLMIVISAQLLSVHHSLHTKLRPKLHLALLLPALAMGPIILIAQDYWFEHLGYQLLPHHVWLIAGVAVAGGLAWIWALFRPGDQVTTRHVDIVIVMAMLFQLTALYIAISAFVPFSDMLPFIQLKVHEWLHGGDLYAVRCLTDTLCRPFPYLPTTAIAYIPFVLADVDPRWMNAISTIFFGFVAFRLNRQGDKALALILAFFLASPLLVARHDLYLGPLWVLLALFVMAVSFDRWLAAAILLSLLATTHQLAFLIPPFFVGYRYLAYRSRTISEGRFLFEGLLVVTVILSIMLWPSGLSLGVYWEMIGRQTSQTSALIDWIVPNSPGITAGPVFNHFMGRGGTLAIQALIYSGILLTAFRKMSRPSDILVYSSLAIITFLMLFTPAEAYLYTISWLLLFGAAVIRCREVLMSSSI